MTRDLAQVKLLLHVMWVLICACFMWEAQDFQLGVQAISMKSNLVKKQNYLV
jgi:hypothetical protein